MMRKEKAGKHFLNKDGHKKLNCAQSIIKAFHDAFGLSEQEVDSFAGFGGGRAPEGKCGAYYAACCLVSKKDPLQIAQLEQGFLDAAGSLKCKEVRKKGKLSCLGCVEKAAELLEGGGDD